MREARKAGGSSAAAEDAQHANRDAGASAGKSSLTQSYGAEAAPAAVGHGNGNVTGAHTGGSATSGLPRLELGSSGNGRLTGDIAPGGGAAAAPAAAPAASGKPAADKKSPLKITSETQATGLPTARTVLGVGEEVKLKGSEAGTWTLSKGTPATYEGDSFQWTAPSTPGSVTVTLKVDKQTTTMTFAVIAPAGIKYKKNYDEAFGGSEQGVGMYMSMDLSPKTVSFQRVVIKEIAGPATGVWGYFAKKSDLGHSPTLGWTPVGEGNVLEGEDHPSMTGWPGPYQPGGLSWIIPNHYAVKGEEGGDGVKFAAITQGMQITDNKGSSAITKDGSGAVSKR